MAEFHSIQTHEPLLLITKLLSIGLQIQDQIPLLNTMTLQDQVHSRSEELNEYGPICWSDVSWNVIHLEMKMYPNKYEIRLFLLVLHLY